MNAFVFAKSLRRAALDRVARERERRPGEADHRYAARLELVPHEANGLERPRHRLLRGRRAEQVDVPPSSRSGFRSADRRPSRSRGRGPSRRAAGGCPRRRSRHRDRTSRSAGASPARRARACGSPRASSGARGSRGTQAGSDRPAAEEPDGRALDWKPSTRPRKTEVGSRSTPSGADRRTALPAPLPRKDRPTCFTTWGRIAIRDFSRRRSSFGHLVENPHSRQYVARRAVLVENDPHRDAARRTDRRSLASPLALVHAASLARVRLGAGEGFAARTRTGGSGHGGALIRHPAHEERPESLEVERGLLRLAHPLDDDRERMELGPSRPITKSLSSRSRPWHASRMS